MKAKIMGLTMLLATILLSFSTNISAETGVSAGAIVITGTMHDPRGTDAPAEGANGGGGSFYNPTRGDNKHTGPYEYIQFMALDNIDFAQAPYSVVVCSNDATLTPNENGWATGGTVSYKFNLTEGTVSKGEFFYVGGTAKVLNGYRTCTLIEIKNVKWIKAVAYNAVAGDGFGTATNGLLKNNGANNISGIAVFAGTEVVASSVPIDAVFYGSETAIGNAGKNGNGYLIPHNDLYNPIGAEEFDQKLFGQGSNTTLMPFKKMPNGAMAAADSSDYMMFGGKLNKNKQWIIPRSVSFVHMHPCDRDYTLSEIESGAGVTIFDQTSSLDIPNTSESFSYANPTSGQLVITGKELINQVDIILPNGQVIRSKTQTALSVSLDNIPAGVYVVKVLTAKGSVFEKVLIK